MTDTPKKDPIAMDAEEEFAFAFDDTQNPRFMLIRVPIGKWAEDGKDGLPLLIGHLQTAEVVAKKTILELRKKRAAGGLISPIAPVIH